MSKVLLVEGPTETALVNYLENEGYLTWPQEGVFVLDALGKYNLHRFMHLFKELGFVVSQVNLPPIIKLMFHPFSQVN